MTKELAEKKCYELINRALRIAREYDPEIYHISCFAIDERPDKSFFASIMAHKRVEGIDENGYPNTVRVLEYSKTEYDTEIGKGEQA